MKEHRPKILFVLHLPPPVHGASTVGLTIRESEVVNSAFDCRFINLATAGSMEDIGRFRFSKLGGVLRLLAEVRRQVADFEPDLVYFTPTSSGKPFIKDYLVRRLLHRLGCRVVAHYHNRGVERQSANPLFRTLYRRFFDGLNVILLSERLYPDVARYVARDKVDFCANGIAPVEVATKPEPECDRPLQLLFLSNLLPDKGVYELLDALKILREKSVKFFCTFVGAETTAISKEAFRLEVAKRNLENNVEYAGPLFGTHKEASYASADVFVFPSKNEAFPLVVLEAMQQALPVVATGVGAVGDMVSDGETGILLPSAASATDIANAISRIASMPDRGRSMGRRGRERFLAEYTTESFEKRFVQILARLLPDYSVEK